MSRASGKGPERTIDGSGIANHVEKEGHWPFNPILDPSGASLDEQWG